MSTTVNVSELKDIVRFAAKAKKKQINIPLFIWGAHGIGKTTIVNEIANEIDYNCSMLNLANQSPEELLGLPNIDKENKKTDYFKPDWLKTDDDKPCIYFIDELNRAPKYVLQAIFSFVNEGRLHTHYIKPNDLVIAAGNPSALDYDVTEFDDKAFLSRFAHVYLEPDHNEVVKYFSNNGSHSVIIEMLREDMEIFDKDTVNDKDKLMIKPDPRMMFRVGQILNVISVSEMKSFGINLVGAMIGEDKATIVADKFINQSIIPSVTEFLDGKLDINKVFSHDRIDIINTFNSKLVKHFINEKMFGKTVSDKIGKVLKQYIEFIPKDSALGMMKEMRLVNVAPVDMIKLFKGVDPQFLFDMLEVESKEGK